MIVVVHRDTSWVWIVNRPRSRGMCDMWQPTLCSVCTRMIRTDVPHPSSVWVLRYIYYWDSYSIDFTFRSKQLLTAWAYQLFDFSIAYGRCGVSLRRLSSWLRMYQLLPSIWDWSRSYCRYELTKLSPELAPNLIVIFLNSDMSNACLDTKRRSSLKSCLRTVSKCLL